MTRAVAVASIDECEVVFHRAGCPPVFRNPSFTATDEVETAFLRRGYRVTDPSHVLSRPLLADDAAASTPLRDADVPKWIEVHGDLIQFATQQKHHHATIVARITDPANESVPATTVRTRDV